MSIPDKIQREHILSARDSWEAGAGKTSSPSTDYDVWIEGKPYPPKAILALAGKLVVDDSFGVGLFGGGESSGCANPFLRARGFVVMLKRPVGYRMPTYPADKSRFGYLLWILHQAADDAPASVAEVQQSLRRTPKNLVALAIAANLRGQTTHNYSESFNTRTIGVGTTAV